MTEALKKETIGLITGGRWHLAPYNFLKKSNFDVIVFDDNPNCFLKKTNVRIEKIRNLDNYKKIFFWAPCNDL